MNMDRLYSVWNQMKQRCRNPNDTSYGRYGGRGIEVRFTSWQQFRDWAIGNSYQQGLTIERIDNMGHYEPSNCRWATPAEQALNTRRTLRLEAFGETKTLVEWVADPRCAVNYVTLVQRVRKIKDMAPEQMLAIPPLPNGTCRIIPGQAELCPSGHDLAVTRVWNKRGDYYCRTCRSEQRKASYRANPEPAKARARANYSRKAKSA